MKNGILEPGEHLMRLSLDNNAFDFLELYVENISKEKWSFKDFKTAIISLIGFYECYFKWCLTLESKERIWKSGKSKDVQFNLEDYESGNFNSISLSECLNIVENKLWISSFEKELIRKHIEIRNKIIHFGIVGDTIFFESNALIFKKDDFDSENNIVSKILNEFSENFSRTVWLSYGKILSRFGVSKKAVES